MYVHQFIVGSYQVYHVRYIYVVVELGEALCYLRMKCSDLKQKLFI